MKSQSSFEFLIVTGVVIIFLVVILGVIVNRTLDFESTRTETFAQSVSERIESEAALARTLPDGYVREFTIPAELESQELEFKIIQGRELVTKANDDEYLTFLSQTVYGQVGVGQNKVLKRGSLIGFCHNENLNNYCLDYDPATEESTNRRCYCGEEFPSEFAGTLLCATAPNLWLDCSINYDTSLVAIRAICLDSSEGVKLNVTHLEDGELFLEEEQYESDDSINFDFPQNLEINESGTWEFKYKCLNPVENKIFVNEFFVPYGTIVAEPVLSGVTGCVNVGGPDSYECQENEEFEVAFDISCVGGECGRTTLWLDPQ